MEQSTKAYEPGTVAVATVNGVKGVRVLRVEWVYGEPGWCHVATEPGGAVLSYEPDVTDIRPLVVLDLGDYDNRAVTYLRNIARDDRAFDGRLAPRAKLVNLIADQIEAQVTPPRIPEPGVFSVVEADTLGPVKGRQRFVRYGEHTERWAMEDGDSYSWDDLIDPTLIREGLS